MYRKDTVDWLKHLDFVLLDMFCLQLAFALSFVFSGHGLAQAYGPTLNRSVAIFIEIIDLVLLFSLNTLKNVLKHGYYRDFTDTLKHGLLLGMTTVLYLFALQRGQFYSRLAFIWMLVLYIGLSYAVRELWKLVLRRIKKDAEGTRSMLLIVTRDVAESVLADFRKHNFGRFLLAGLVVLDQDLTGQCIEEIPVVASEETVAEYVCKEWVDEVLIVTSGVVPYPRKLIDQLTETGVILHMNLAKISKAPGKKQFVEKIGSYTVLTTSINYASASALFMKRFMDIVGGLVGCFITGILCIFIAPAIYLASPGPIFFTQERVGKNGKLFKMYKFRSMYPDAEARKAALMKENKCSDERMFKMDFDPRVIGNVVLPDGRHKTGIGEFIRKTSIDEFPQFFNVLKGDMSIVGTRPPLISETNQYELHHHARLAIKPGITGLWQVSGRSNITDFEEVVNLDKEYIENWSIGLDVKILLKTIMVVVKKEGSV